MDISRKKYTKIGEILVKLGFLNFEQLKEGLAFQRDQGRGKMLGQILIELEFISANQLNAAIAVQKGYPYINVNNCVINSLVLNLIPEAVVKRYLILPIDKIRDTISLAMVNPMDEEAVNIVKDISQSEPEIFLTTADDMQEAIVKYYGEGKKLR
ncbi:MAG: hypothetical protein ABIH27_03230 [Candidatus Omnitrophota bacterium]